jgi:hypothetical protein
MGIGIDSRSINGCLDHWMTDMGITSFKNTKPDTAEKISIL